MVAGVGFEPTAFSLWGWRADLTALPRYIQDAINYLCSTQLCYLPHVGGRIGFEPMIPSSLNLKSKLLYASFLNFNRNALRFRALPLSYISYLSKIWLDSNQQPLLNRQFVINYFAVCIPLLIFFSKYDFYIQDTCCALLNPNQLLYLIFLLYVSFDLLYSKLLLFVRFLYVLILYQFISFVNLFR